MNAKDIKSEIEKLQKQVDLLKVTLEKHEKSEREAKKVPIVSVYTGIRTDNKTHRIEINRGVYENPIGRTIGEKRIHVFEGPEKECMKMLLALYLAFEKKCVEKGLIVPIRENP